MSKGGPRPLDVLAEKSGRDFPHLFEARQRTASGLRSTGQRLERLVHEDETSVVLMGSWGRAEVTAGSDDDFMVLVHGPDRAEVRPSVEEVAEVLGSSPGTQGIFGVPVFSE
jgi:UTP:GlnB (protein PII) uridylyltransferase